jgi:hypothetical protein
MIIGQKKKGKGEESKDDILKKIKEIKKFLWMKEHYLEKSMNLI